MKTSLVWLTYHLDAEMLKSSVVSASNELKGEVAYHIFQDSDKPLPEETVAFFRESMPWVHVHPRTMTAHKGMYGKDNIGRILRLLQIAAKLSGTQFATKIDSDCVVSGKKFLSFLDPSKHSFVGTANVVGNWGAFYHIRTDVLNSLNALEPSVLHKVIDNKYIDVKKYDLAPNHQFGEDDVLPQIVESLFGKSFLDGNPVDGLDKEFFFECFYPSRYLGDLESLTEKYDVIEFGRRELTAAFLNKPEMTWLERQQWLYGHMCQAMQIINDRRAGKLTSDQFIPA